MCWTSSLKTCFTCQQLSQTKPGPDLNLCTRRFVFMLSLDSVRLTDSIQCKLNQPANITIKSCATMADHQPSLLIKTFSIYCLKKYTKNLAKCGLLIILLNLQPAFLHCTGQLK